MSDDTALLAHLTRALGPLPPTMAALCQQAQPTMLAKGAALLREGVRWQHLWWLERGANRSPVGKSLGDGTVPGTWWRRPEPDSMDSTEPKRPRVYSWRGSVNSSTVDACSTTWPAYMTVIA